jgi:hypothetical protein
MLHTNCDELFDSSVGIGTGYELNVLSLIPGRRKILLISTESRPALKPTQPPFQWILGAISLWREADTQLHLLPRSRLLELHPQSPPPYIFMAQCLIH